MKFVGYHGYSGSTLTRQFDSFGAVQETIDGRRDRSGSLSRSPERLLRDATRILARVALAGEHAGDAARAAVGGSLRSTVRSADSGRLIELTFLEYAVSAPGKLKPGLGDRFDLNRRPQMGETRAWRPGPDRLGPRYAGDADRRRIDPTVLAAYPPVRAVAPPPRQRVVSAAELIAIAVLAGVILATVFLVLGAVVLGRLVSAG